MTAAPSPSADQVAALLARAASGRLLPAEQRLLGDLLTQARASLAGQGAALTRTRATLATTIAERDEQRKLAERRTVTAAGLLESSGIKNQRIARLEAELAEARQQLAARDDQHAPATVDCPRCPARAGRPCRAPSGQQVPYHAPRRIAAQQAAGVGQ